MGGAFDMEKCIKCGGTLPAGAKLCPYCGNPVSYYEEKMQPVQPASRKQTRSRTILIVAVSVLSVLLIASLAFAIVMWTATPAAAPKLGVSPGSLDYGTLQVGSQSSQVLTLSNSGKQDLNWSADKGKADWLTLDPSAGRIPAGGSQTINVRADATLLTAGQYSASISFSSNGGGASVSAVLTVASRPPSLVTPVVASISPTSGPAIGGTTVTITGSGFTGATKVLFGTATSTFTVNSDTQITAVSPGGSGTVDVTVTTPGGTTKTSIADQFTYQGVPIIPTIPTIASISPTAGPVTGKTSVIIRGTGFTGASKVLFGTVPASFTLNSATQITAVSPAGSGTVDVTVTTPLGTSATSTADRFTYRVAPIVTSISPTVGPLAGRTSVIIKGTGFTGASKVLFGSVSASFTLNSDTQVTAVSPAGSGTVDVKVTTLGGTSVTSTADRFTYLPIPTVTSISPTSGPLAGGTVVTIRGSGFTGASQVRFGTVAVSTFTVNSDGTQIAIYSPASSTGTVHVTVTTPKGTSATSVADQFTYLPVPTIASISPTAGPLAGGTTVTITGTGFTGVSKVLFGSTASIFTVKSSTQITVISPPSSAGTVDVTVITPGGTSATSTADRFTYLPVPTVASISPTSGPAAGGTFVTITGTGFTTDSQVRFGSVAASNFTVVSATQITAFSPAGSGKVDVTVTTPGGTSATSTADQFTYVPVPVVTSVSPNSGPATGGTTVTIKGSGFKDASEVRFGSVAAGSFTVNSDGTQITVTSPASSTGPVHVTVTTLIGGISTTTNADLFQYI
jgi:IPT/TIG domain-containing protein/BACON domain-containing protein